MQPLENFLCKQSGKRKRQEKDIPDDFLFRNVIKKIFLTFPFYGTS